MAISDSIAIRFPPDYNVRVTEAYFPTPSLFLLVNGGHGTLRWKMLCGRVVPREKSRTKRLAAGRKEAVSTAHSLNLWRS